jgi:hypothetical protein
MNEELKKKAFNLYTAPFSCRYGYIWDAEGNMVADDVGGDAMLRIRGWGRLGAMEDGDKIQDAVGDLIAEILTDYWNTRTKDKQ